MENFGLKDLKNKRVHFVGIGGISMSALAQILAKNKVIVQGSDECENDEVKKLKKKGFLIFDKHQKSNLKNVQVVVYSSAIKEDNKELVEAKRKKLLLIKRAELLGLVAEGYKTVISVAGSHGKTTTTAMIAEMFRVANKKPTFHLGGSLASTGRNYSLENKKYFITESCEYKDNYLFLKPDISVILNIDADHLDYFKSLEGVKSSFLKFSENTKAGGINIVCKDDPDSIEILKQENSLSFGFSKKADIYAKNVKEYKKGYYSFEVVFSKCNLGNIKLGVFGRHNVTNALAAILVAIVCDIDFCDIKKVLENFVGVKRRCERVGEINGAVVYHDYAHHPEQIKKMIAVANEIKQASSGKIYVVFEPHTYSRTKHLFDEFVTCFDGADKLFLAPVYSARENPIEGYDSLKLYNGVKSKISAELVDTYEEILKKLKEETKADDVVLVLGAGSIEKLARMV